MSKYYSTDEVFHELERIYRGHAEIDLCVQSLLDASPGWVFSRDEEGMIKILYALIRRQREYLLKIWHI